jgi:hypothetical protein
MPASLPFVSKYTNGYQRSRREHGPGKKSKKDATLELQNPIAASISTYWSSIKWPSAWTSMIWDRPKTLHTEFTSRIISPFSGNNSTYQKHTHNSLNRAWTNGSSYEWSGNPTQTTIHQSSAHQKNKAKDSGLYRTSGCSTNTHTSINTP